MKLMSSRPHGSVCFIYLVVKRNLTLFHLCQLARMWAEKAKEKIQKERIRQQQKSTQIMKQATKKKKLAIEFESSSNLTNEQPESDTSSTTIDLSGDNRTAVSQENHKSLLAKISELERKNKLLIEQNLKLLSKSFSIS